MVRSGSTGRARSRRLRWLGAGALVVIGLLYYKPVQSYFDTRGALSERAAEVRSLRNEHAALRRRLAARTTEEALVREARRLGYVKPGERLFIVKGVRAWRRSHAGSRAAGPQPRN